ncbi:MAG: hypothetical protein CSA45_06950 [Gammaproteobacteria bacterium]|nr:MAG: hypothetical protein CSA45_06950 [Gammaproteobacteria bacterium]
MTTPGRLMDSTANNRSNPQADAFLQQLQHTLLTLAKPAQPVADTDKQMSILTSALQRWIAALYHARHNGDGYLNIHDIGTRQLPSISELQAIFPALISTASDDNLTAPIVIFDRFVAFCRDYLLFQQIANYLQRPQQLLPLDPKLLETTVSDGQSPAINEKPSAFWALSATTRLHHQQQLAAVAAASLPFCIISGGAGTGKTTAVLYYQRRGGNR